MSTKKKTAKVKTRESKEELVMTEDMIYVSDITKRWDDYADNIKL